jgi:hypothetical protein
MMKVLFFCIMLVLMYYFIVHVLWNNRKLKSWMPNCDEGSTFLSNVSYNLCFLLCGYYEATKDYNLKPWWKYHISTWY